MNINNEYNSDNNPYTDSYTDLCDPYTDLCDPYTNFYINSDTNPQDNNNELPRTLTRRKTTDESVEEQSTKKIRVNFDNSTVTNPSYVWKYFKIEKDGHTYCKILVLRKGSDIECRTNYKHDSRTGNMKLHLRTKHDILGPDDFTTNPNKKYQLQIDKIVKKVTPHKETIQTKLKRVTAK
ncbi:1132_t:CDS:2 [Cetraspora pellucida]|uniref:1132_t:CDS:1 n=1 Tax=Cetraspora pellucida TaxID=1433469 RepID=A0ACA9LVS4_9GLOM|nr:1132_t:CDS:2 [Cetraspora pellucida]